MIYEYEETLNYLKINLIDILLRVRTFNQFSLSTDDILT